MNYIQREARGGSLARAIEVLDAAFPDLDATSQLLVARRAADGGLSARAASGFARSPANLLTDRDHIAWARASIATGRNTEAARRIGDRRFGPGAVAEARYLRGLALVRAGSRTAARGAIDRVIRLNAGTPWAADATYLLADLESDAGNERRARDLHQAACTQARPGSFSDNACFRDGILSFALGDPRRAATAFDALPRRFPSSPEVMAALYWSGRAHARAGNAAVARERWTAAMKREPLSYYAVTSAKRLDTQNWTPVVTPGPLPRDPSIDMAMTRAARLSELGMPTEERHEYDEVERDVAESPELALAAGAAFLERGQVPRAIRVGWRAVAQAERARGDSAAADERAYRIVYPMLHEAEVVARSRENRLDPALVAAVIRQESQWFPRALSVAGARGLMQVMPSVGEAIARSRTYPVWDPALLFDPHVSLELGTSHLRAALSQYSSLPRALAAYNAGGSRVRRWAQRVGASDPELFTERIPFVETRDYVRIVQRNAELYRALYDLEP
jgi:soluble lytic murein transglycosylase